MSATDIFNAIAAWTVQFDSDVTVLVRNYNAIKETMPSAGTPCRVLQPLTSPGDPFAFIALGKTNKITWKIEDTCYIKPVAQGDGIKSEGAHIVQYAQAYRTAMQDNRSPTAASHIVGGSITPGVYDWNGVSYFGVKCIVQVEEFQSS
jgi:hypothetical protein